MVGLGRGFCGGCEGCNEAPYPIYSPFLYILGRAPLATGDLNRESEATIDAPARRKQTILIVDDSPMNRALLAGIIGDDFNVVEAENGF